MKTGRPWRVRWRGEQGQTFTEYTMILGLLAAIIIALTEIIVPGFAYLVVALVEHMAKNVSSVAQ